jgi:aminoglycoside phosphotransferase (APT) family kinase protein
VYRNVLAVSTLPAPVFFGAHQERPGGVTCLLLEYLEDSIPASLGSQPETLRSAARWIGEFHAINEERIRRPETTFLTRYEAGYYAGWARRTAEFARSLHRHFPWLATLCQAFETSVVELLLPSSTIIHGEYYPRNILWHDRRIYPIDWESAAVGPGEIDLACLTDGWPSHVTTSCEREYRRARWPSGAPTAFARRLDAARMYVHLRWLGDWPPQTLEKGFRWRFDELRRVGRRLGML